MREEGSVEGGRIRIDSKLRREVESARTGYIEKAFKPEPGVSRHDSAHVACAYLQSP